MENRGAIVQSRESLAFPMENPFSFKFGQVFTGFGIGCGIGVGVGQPVHLGNFSFLSPLPLLSILQLFLLGTGFWGVFQREGWEGLAKSKV